MTRIKTREKTVKRLMTASAAAGEEEPLPIIEITAHFQILGTNLNTLLLLKMFYFTKEKCDLC